MFSHQLYGEITRYGSLRLLFSLFQIFELRLLSVNQTVGESVSQWVYFRADGAGWGEGEKLRARKCRNCNNVQLFTYD